MNKNFFFIALLIILAAFANNVSGQFVPMQRYQYKAIAADTLYNWTGDGAPTGTPNSYRRIVQYYDSTNHVLWYWQPENQTWTTNAGGSTADTAYLFADWGLVITSDNPYKPNGENKVLSVDSALIRQFIEEVGSTDTNLVVNSNATFLVKFKSAAPVTDAEGDKYLVEEGATGAFTGHDNEIARKTGGVYTFEDADAGDQLIVDNAEDNIYESYYFDGTDWHLTNIALIAGGNRRAGNLIAGTRDAYNFTLKANDLPALTIDTNQNVAVNKFINSPSNNFVFIDSATGNLDTGFFNRLLPGTNITFDTSDNDITINASGGGGGSTNVYAPLVKSGDTIHQRFNVLHYGATGDGVYDTSISITSGTDDVTSDNSIFQNTDVGKIIVIMGAGVSGRDFVATITGYTSATAVTVSSNAGTTVSDASALFGTNQTTSIQAAINACYYAGGGTVYIPNGIYVISGALQTNVNGENMNSQLYIPAGSTAFNDSLTSIAIQGEGRPNFTQYAGNPLVVTDLNSYTGTVLVSTLTSYTSRAAMFGTNGPTSVLGSSYNYNYVSFENLSIKVLANPGGAGPVIGGINYRYGAGVITKQVFICPMGSGVSSVMPTNDIAGIETPDVNSEAMTSLRETASCGFKNGFIIGEHVSFDEINAFVCYYGLNFKMGHHATSGGRVLVQWCTNDIYFSGSLEVNIDQFDDEWMYSEASGGVWFDNLYTINDSLNRGFNTMSINYSLDKYFVGLDNSHLTLNGAEQLILVSYNRPIVSMYNSATVDDASSTPASANIYNSNPAGGASFTALRNSGGYASVSAFGSGHSNANYSGKGVFRSSGEMVLNTDASVSTGGSGNLYVFTGGSATANYTARFTAGSPGEFIVPGKIGIGATATPTSPLTISAAGPTIVRITGTSASSVADINLFNDAGAVGQIFKTGSSFSTYKNVSANDFGIYNGTAGNMSFISDHASGNINFSANGASSAQMTLTSSALTLTVPTITTQYRLSALNAAPSSASDTGTTGEVRITSTFIYVCVATNTWVRAALATW